MDGLTCYTYNQMCDSNAYCASDHRDEMGCDWSGFPGKLVALFLLWLCGLVMIILYSVCYPLLVTHLLIAWVQPWDQVNLVVTWITQE